MDETEPIEAGWSAITGHDASLIRWSGLAVHETVTDPSGQYGSPLVYTEWGDDDGPVLRSWRYPAYEVTDHPDGYRPNRKPCEHHLADRVDRAALREAGRLVLVAQWEAKGLPVPAALHRQSTEVSP